MARRAFFADEVFGSGGGEHGVQVSAQLQNPSAKPRFGDQGTREHDAGAG